MQKQKWLFIVENSSLQFVKAPFNLDFIKNQVLNLLYVVNWQSNVLILF